MFDLPTEVMVLAAGGGWESNLLLALFLVGLGLVFILAEIFFVSFGALTLCSLTCLTGAVVIAFNNSGGWGVAFILLELVLIPMMIVVGLKKMPRTRWGKRLIPDGPSAEELEGSGAAEGLEALIGKEGRTMTMCRPAGTAEIDGRRRDVVSEGVTIPADAAVRVMEIEGNRVVVREIDEATDA